MGIVNFEEMIAWQKSQLLAKDVYTLLRYSKDYSFKDQLQRAVVSISNNIAEGFERKSNKEFKQFLFIAKGSCGEVRSMIYLGNQLGYISQGDMNSLLDSSSEISRILAGLIKKL